jgi:molybdopterin/thiamine biosynthesis adenylyltransferase/rhodanese-related sulfurtransferase
MQPDYSRQSLLKEIGPQGQAALGRARVLIVGLGGLGSPVLQYLAGAGVGCLGLVDADLLDASNLHRQPIYAFSQIGQPKVSLASAAVTAINPSVRVETHAAKLNADNALELVRAYDIVIDCSDNFRAKYLINDAAVLAQKPAVFASVYQYEGQIQVYRPEPEHACLRCLWPDATADGVVGNCAEAGVLGPVPGAFGALQALLTFSSVKIKAARRPQCLAPRCALIREIKPDDPGLEMRLESLAAAAERGLTVIDIRTAQEVAAQPTGARHIPMGQLLANPSLLESDREVLLVCASGKRSLATAQELRKHGVRARSLAGGLSALRH